MDVEGGERGHVRERRERETEDEAAMGHASTRAFAVPLKSA